MGNMNPNYMLVGNAFPLSLIRRKVRIEPVSIKEFKYKLKNCDKIYSFWGHINTLTVINRMTGYDFTPDTERPAITLSEKNLPCFSGKEFKECWIVSPDYTSGYRPKIGEEVAVEKIIGWHILKIIWE